METVSAKEEKVHPHHDLAKVFGVEEINQCVGTSARAVQAVQNKFFAWEDECWRLFVGSGDMDVLAKNLAVQLENTRNMLQVLVERLKNPKVPNPYERPEERRRPMDFDDLIGWLAGCLRRYQDWSDYIAAFNGDGRVLGGMLSTHMAEIRSVLIGLAPPGEEVVSCRRILESAYRVGALDVFYRSGAFDVGAQGGVGDSALIYPFPGERLGDVAMKVLAMQ